MGSANWFYIDGSGATVGPLSSETMKDLAKDKVIKSNTLIRLNETSDWQRSSDSNEFHILIVLGRKQSPVTQYTPPKSGTKYVREEPTILKGSVPIGELVTRWDEAKAEKTRKAPADSEPGSDRQQTKPASSDTESRKRCPMCAEWILSAAKKCRYCQSSLVDGKSGNRKEKSQASSAERTVACCARCGSSQLATSKVGFGLGKAILGTIAFGPLGALGGAVGSNNIKITCLQCGLEMSPGSGR